MKYIKITIVTILFNIFSSLNITAQSKVENSLIGMNAPVFSVKDIQGNKKSLNSLKGKIIILNFWFIECKPCVREIPELNNLVKKYKNDNVEFIGFSGNGSMQINSFLKEQDFLYNIVPNSKSVIKDYRISSYPTNIIIDQNAKVVYVTKGLKSTTVNEIEEVIKSLIKE